MAVWIVIPKLGMSVDEVQLVEWKENEGEWVEKGSVILVIETQKTEWNIDADASGYLHIIIPAGSKTKIGAVVGGIAESREELQALDIGSSPQPGAETDKAYAASWKRQIDPAVQEMAANERQPSGQRIRITPAARKVAEEHMVDVTKVPGTGPGGRITREDIENAIKAKAEAGGVQPGAAEVYLGRRVKETIQLKGMRKAIAEHMYRSLSVAAQMTVMGELEISETIRLREGLVKAEEEIGLRVSYIDILVFILARALKQHPDINCALFDDDLKIWEDINIGVALALGAQGLIVPVVKNADLKSIGDICREVRALAEKGQTGKLTPDEVSGGTFTLTSLGKRGVSFFQTPILNQPEAAILATGQIMEKPVVRDGQIVIRPVMPYSLTFDHRAINGFGAERFMGKVQSLLATPGLLLV
ncbi:MAG: dihydrolipoamide acetyltransferase family protein [Syntrophorhabdaceae bacterium]